jgi:hypothetical protein
MYLLKKREREREMKSKNFMMGEKFLIIGRMSEQPKVGSEKKRERK